MCSQIKQYQNHCYVTKPKHASIQYQMQIDEESAILWFRFQCQNACLKSIIVNQCSEKQTKKKQTSVRVMLNFLIGYKCLIQFIRVCLFFLFFVLFQTEKRRIIKAKREMKKMKSCHSNHKRFQWNQMEWNKTWLTVDISYLILLIIYFNWNFTKAWRINDWRILIELGTNNWYVFNRATQITRVLTMQWKKVTVPYTLILNWKHTMIFIDFSLEWVYFSFEKRIHQKKEKTFCQCGVIVSPIQCFRLHFFHYNLWFESTSYSMMSTMVIGTERHTHPFHQTLQEIS